MFTWSVFCSRQLTKSSFEVIPDLVEGVQNHTGGLPQGLGVGSGGGTIRGHRGGAGTRPCPREGRGVGRMLVEPSSCFYLDPPPGVELLLVVLPPFWIFLKSLYIYPFSNCSCFLLFRLLSFSDGGKTAFLMCDVPPLTEEEAEEAEEVVGSMVGALHRPASQRCQVSV